MKTSGVARIALGFVGLLPLAACTGKLGGSDSSGVDPTVAPTITAVSSVTCGTQESAGEVWNLALTVADPQGADTVNGGTVVVLGSDGVALGSYVLACGNGACAGTFRAIYDNIGCSLMGSVTLEFTVSDVDGHASLPFAYPT